MRTFISIDPRGTKSSAPLFPTHGKMAILIPWPTPNIRDRSLLVLTPLGKRASPGKCNGAYKLIGTAAELQK